MALLWVLAISMKLRMRQGAFGMAPPEIFRMTLYAVHRALRVPHNLDGTSRCPWREAGTPEGAP